MHSYQQIDDIAREALQRASLAAYECDTGHILAALCGVDDVRVSAIMESLGVDPTELVAAVDEVRAVAAGETHHGGFSDEAKRAIEFMVKNSATAHPPDSALEFLLIGLARDGIAAMALRRFGLDEAGMRTELVT